MKKDIFAAGALALTVQRQGDNQHCVQADRAAGAALD